MAKGIKIAKVTDEGVLVDQGQESELGGTGGKSQAITATGIKTIDVQYVTPTGTAVAHGYIISQKGAKKFLVADADAVGTNVATITLVNKAEADLLPGEASISCTNTAGDPFFASRITTKHVYDFAGNKYIYKVNVNATATTAEVAGY